MRSLERRTAEAAAPRARRQELVQQVAVAVFQIDEVEAFRLRQVGRVRIAGDQFFDLGVAEHGAIVEHAGTAIE